MGKERANKKPSAMAIMAMGNGFSFGQPITYSLSLSLSLRNKERYRAEQCRKGFWGRKENPTILFIITPR